jgi:hypothetical protein
MGVLPLNVTFSRRDDNASESFVMDDGSIRCFETNL